MPDVSILQGLSPRRIFGFACNQGFVFFLFYIILVHDLNLGALHLERADLLGTLFFMVLGFLFIRFSSEQLRTLFGSRTFLFIFAFFLTIGSLIPFFVQTLNLFWFIFESFLIGISCSFLLAIWGRTLGTVSTKVSIPEVFLGSLFGAFIALLASFFPFPELSLALRILPFINAFFLFPSASLDSPFSSVNISDNSSKAATRISFKIIAGTTLFGMAAGLVEVFYAEPGVLSVSTLGIAFLLFAAFAIGTLTTLLSENFGRGTALNKAYRLAIFIMLLGLLFIPTPIFDDSAVSGVSILLAGYLGLSAVLVSLFLVLANVTHSKTSVFFSRGFAALFAGELAGTIIGNFFFSVQPQAEIHYGAIVLAGILVLVSYIFLFTEKDFDDLTEIVSISDIFNQRCQALSETFLLSKREAEILPFVLKGRTSERISQELFITKSTVDTHLQRIYRKTEVHNRQELIDLSEEIV